MVEEEIIEVEAVEIPEQLHVPVIKKFLEARLKILNESRIVAYGPRALINETEEVLALIEALEKGDWARVQEFQELVETWEQQ